MILADNLNATLRDCLKLLSRANANTSTAEGTSKLSRSLSHMTLQDIAVTMEKGPNVEDADLDKFSNIQMPDGESRKLTREEKDKTRELKNEIATS
jgi:hypothetical protein